VKGILPRTAAALALAACLAGCSLLGRSPGKPGAARDEDLELLASWMTGSFSSAEQAAADSSYFDIRLHTARIWAEREDGVWLYVEQSLATQEHRPYRQRVYRLERVAADTLSSTGYMLPGETRFVGAWRSPLALSALDPDSLEGRDGCTTFLTRVKPLAFRGGTRGDGCESMLRGAAYETAEATVTPDGLLTWDRGFDRAGAQVWGATSGGYVFRRLTGN
jgi:hypothetical protein